MPQPTYEEMNSRDQTALTENVTNPPLHQHLLRTSQGRKGSGT